MQRRTLKKKSKSREDSSVLYNRIPEEDESINN